MGVKEVLTDTSFIRREFRLNCSENALIPNPSSAREGSRILILWSAETAAWKIGITQKSPIFEKKSEYWRRRQRWA
jgi:hypothetical protein